MEITADIFCVSDDFKGVFYIVMLKPLDKKDLQANIPVEWPVYSSSGRLLLHPGQSFLSEQLIEVLLWRGLFRGNKSTRDSNDYEEFVDIEDVVLADPKTDKTKEKINNEFIALANENPENNSGNEEEESKETIIDLNTKFGDDFDFGDDEEADSSDNKSIIFTESEKLNLINKIKNDVLDVVRSELESFFQGSFREQVQSAIKKEVQQEIQQNVVSQLGSKIDGKIKNEINHFIENEYGREKNNPFNKLIVLSSQLDLIYSGLDEQSPECSNSILSLASDIQALCAEYPDAMLMSVHLFNYGSYTIHHPIHMAILCELVCVRKNIDDKEYRRYIVAAALTCDFSMRDLQKKLQSQSSPLLEEQREEINFHTVQSVALLLNIGVKEPVWLDTVAQHHERKDGSGYPLNYVGDEICIGARVLAVSDRYCAMVTGRTYRNALHGKEALSAFLSEQESIYDKASFVALIGELSVYPPGTFVRLANGEYAVVTRRGEDAPRSQIQPIVLSFADENGNDLNPPVVRETKLKKYSVKETVFWDKRLPLSPEDIWQLSSGVN